MNIPKLTEVAGSDNFRQYLIDLLMDICRHDTSIRHDVPALRQAESDVFDILEHHLENYGLAGSATKRVPIDCKIANHPYFSQLYYTQSPQTPQGLTVKQTYDGRANLIYMVDGSDQRDTGMNLAINGHIDVVAPFFGPRIEGDRVYGRGACDDKGNIVALFGAIKLVGQYLQDTGKTLNKHLTAMCVIEEEMGGNGSLSAAIDRDLKKRYESLMVLEICESKIYPGNRGCVWYKVEANQTNGQLNLFEAAAYIIEQLEKEGRSLRAESAHPLFPHRPVQTCHGIICNNGEHPSRINGEVAFDINSSGANNIHSAETNRTIEDVLQFALDEYIGLYKDKTKATDPATGKPKVNRHYDIEVNTSGFKVTVYGSTGHMGSIFENDGAITKMMTMVRALIRSRDTIERFAGGPVTFGLHGWDQPSILTLEGGQGFLPTHAMTDVQDRLVNAVHRGAGEYLRLVGSKESAPEMFLVTYEKLHNAAFAGEADSPEMRNAIDAARAAKIWKDEPIRGWDVSCDSRIFAGEYPQMTVLTTGPGSLNFAHSDQEHIEITEMVKFSEFLAYYILKQTGTID